MFGHSSGLQVLGNLLLLVPLFAVAPLRHRGLWSPVRVLVAAAGVSATVECSPAAGGS